MHEVFVNGDFVKPQDAKVSIFDTGFYYGDGIYEVALVYRRKFIDIKDHIARFCQALTEAHIDVKDTSIFGEVAHSLLKRNPLIETGMLYMQVTRGFNDNRYLHPSQINTPTIIAYISPVNLNFEDMRISQSNCILVPDPRRHRRDIKMTSLMPVVLSKFDAKEAACDYVLYFDRETGAVTEGISSNIFIVKDGEIWTHPLDHKILAGCTRLRMIELLRNTGYKVFEKEFFQDDILSASEVFVTGSIKLLRNVATINGTKIGNGNTPVFNAALAAYIEYLQSC